MAPSSFDTVRDFLKYVAASVIALLVDYVTYWLLIQKNVVQLTIAAPVGYTAGLIVAYSLISKKVFSDGWLKEKRAYEMLLLIYQTNGVITTNETYSLFYLSNDNSKK